MSHFDCTCDDGEVTDLEALGLATPPQPIPPPRTPQLQARGPRGFVPPRQVFPINNQGDSPFGPPRQRPQLPPRAPRMVPMAPTPPRPLPPRNQMLQGGQAPPRQRPQLPPKRGPPARAPAMSPPPRPQQPRPQLPPRPPMPPRVQQQPTRPLQRPPLPPKGSTRPPERVSCTSESEDESDPIAAELSSFGILSNSDLNQTDYDDDRIDINAIHLSTELFDTSEPGCLCGDETGNSSLGLMRSGQMNVSNNESLGLLPGCELTLDVYDPSVLDTTLAPSRNCPINDILNQSISRYLDQLEKEEEEQAERLMRSFQEERRSMLISAEDKNCTC